MSIYYEMFQVHVFRSSQVINLGNNPEKSVWTKWEESNCGMEEDSFDTPRPFTFSFSLSSCVCVCARACTNRSQHIMHPVTWSDSTNLCRNKLVKPSERCRCFFFLLQHTESQSQCWLPTLKQPTLYPVGPTSQPEVSLR